MTMRGCLNQRVTEVHHFEYGWINPVFAYALSFLGCLLGLTLTDRSRSSTGASRVRWLTLAAVAIGGTGIWLMHFMAMLGFDVPESVVRYDVGVTAASFGVAVVIVSLGLYTVGIGRPAVWKIVTGGAFTGVGVAAMHYMGMSAMRVAGFVRYDPVRVALSVLIAIVAATVALWFALVIQGAAATVGAALLMGVAVCSMHYTAMSAVHIELVEVPATVPGVSPFGLLAPICVLACVMISTLAYSTIGYSLRQNSAREEALLARARDMRAAAAGLRPFTRSHRAR
jgi:NO-binding membrane sensor protein with MHYT domain